MKADIKKVVASSAGEIIAVAALVTATVVVDMISDKLKEIADEKKKPAIMPKRIILMMVSMSLSSSMNRLTNCGL